MYQTWLPLLIYLLKSAVGATGLPIILLLPVIIADPLLLLSLNIKFVNALTSEELM